MTTPKETYVRHNIRSIVFTVAVVVVCLILIVFSVSMGDYPIGFSEAYGIIVDHILGNTPDTYEGHLKDFIVCDLNMGHVLGAVLVGAVLSVAGAAMQMVLRNPLADPYSVGISSGASFGVTLSIVAGFTIFPVGGLIAGQIVNAFVFSLIPMAAILAISVVKRTSPTMTILVGVSLMYLFSAATTLMKVTAEPNKLAEAYRWAIGSLGTIPWADMPFVIAAATVSVVFMTYMAGRLNILTTNRNLVQSLGINHSRTSAAVMLVASLTTSTVVCFTGTIGFVGLVAPHLARTISGSNARYLIPCSAAMGMLMLLVSDIVARLVSLPVGVITALIGAPVFLYFLIRNRKTSWNW
ncbi:MAG: iron ABC transporter permease [Candidatus Methanomethylophilaceae archaeon]|nr:iron ABC transporter permease [Candidatus Methanomethylophilaceae archaeon]